LIFLERLELKYEANYFGLNKNSKSKHIFLTLIMSFMNKKILIFIALIFFVSNAQTFSSSAVAQVNMIKPLSIKVVIC
jgi:hypothetical protein